MKNLLFIALIFGIHLNSQAQESFKKRYKTPNKVSFRVETVEDNVKGRALKKDKEELIVLKKDTLVSFNYFNKTKQDSIYKKYISAKPQSITYKKERKIGNETLEFDTTVIIDKEYLKSIKYKVTKTMPFELSTAFVKQEKEKIHVNPYLRKLKNGKYGNRDVYYYKLKNRQTLKLRFNEFTVSTLTIPIKYRFQGKKGIPENFTTDLSGYIMASLGGGKSKFMYREEVGNKVNTWKLSGSILAGVSTVTLDSLNTSRTDSPSPLDSETSLTRGLLSFGCGILGNYNKAGIGIFIGLDYGVGRLAERWDYKGKPWVGLGIGYSIF